MKTSILALLYCALMPIMVGSTCVAQEPSNLSLVLLIGQSNMAGRGKIEPQDKEPIPGVFKLNADNQWEPALDPLHWDKPQAGVGLGREFSRVLVNARPGAQIGLIPAAVGGTGLDRWRPGADLYNQALERLRAAEKSGKLVAILWHQGESESGSATRSAVYAKEWVAMMKQLREDAGAQNVPVVAGELGEYLYTRSGGKSPYARVVNEQIDSLPKLLERVAIAPSKGLTHRGDELHFDADSMREFGRRYAAEFLILVPDWSASSSQPSP